MSLLMEALRKAEQAKHRMQQETEAARGSLDASGNPSTSPSSFTLEEREASVTPEYIRDTFAGVQDADAQDDTHAHDASPDEIDAEEAGAHARHAAQRQQRAAAASVFAAKQKPAHNRRTLALLVTIMLLMVPVGAQLRRHSGRHRPIQRESGCCRSGSCRNHRCSTRCRKHRGGGSRKSGE